MNTILRRGLGVCFLAAIIGTSIAHGQIVVSTATDAALRSAIATAKTTGEPITINVSGTITLTNTLEITANTVIDASSNTVILSGNAKYRVFHVTSGRSLALTNLTIIGGVSSNGPAICNEGGVVTVNTCIFAMNTATNAAGTNGRASTDDGSGENGNDGGRAFGGAIYNTGVLYVDTSLFLSNYVFGGDGGDGGAGGTGTVLGGKGGKGGMGGVAAGGGIHNSGTAQIYNSCFEGNLCVGGGGGTPGAGGKGGTSGDGGDSGLGGASIGAGVYNTGSLVLSQCLFVGNTNYGGNSSGVAAYPGGGSRKAGYGASAKGGGLFSRGTASVENCTFYLNACHGGIGGSVTAANTTSGDGGDACGGAVATTGGTVELINCTLATNNVYGGTNGSITTGTNTSSSATSGSRGRSQGGNLYQSGGSIKIRNSIVSKGTSGENSSGGLVDGGYNISSDGSCGFKATGSKNNTSARLDSGLADHGGVIMTLATLPDSPAVNAIPTTGSYPEFDERGVQRPQGMKVDIGAYEVQTDDFPPSITTDLEDQNVALGKNITLSVTATGLMPLYYQWYLNDVAIAHATNATYKIQSANSFDEGNYRVTVSNDYSDTDSATAFLNVVVPVTIVTQPLNTTTVLGTNFSLKVKAAGEETITYQWYHNGGLMAGQEESVLTIGSAKTSDAGTYWVVVSNDAGAVKSVVANVNLIQPVAITTQPVDQRVDYGKNATLSVKATGAGPIYYQWYFNGTALQKATGRTLSISRATATNEGDYTVEVRNAISSITSTDVYLTVCPPVPIVARMASLVTNDSLVLKGSIVTNAGIKTVSCRVNGMVYSATLNGAAWSVTLPLIPGTNIVSTFAGNENAFSALVTNKFFYDVPSTLTVNIKGSGSVTPNLNGKSLNVGKSYSMTAKPDSGNLFKEWLVGEETVATTPTYSFTMSSNLSLTAVFVKDPYIAIKGSYVGIFTNAESLMVENSGLLTLMLKEKGVFTATLMQGQFSYRLSGQFDLEGKATLNRNKLTPLTLKLDFENSTNDVLIGTVTDGLWTSDLQAVRTVSSSSVLKPLAGRYTMALTLPDADGYGAVALNVAPAGGVTFTGSLVDGAALSGMGTVCVGGVVPVYLPVNSGLGVVAGWLCLTNVDEPTAGLRWRCPGNGVFFTGGFSSDLTYDLSSYPKNAPVLLVDPTVELQGGNLTNLVSFSATQTSKTVFVGSDESTVFKLTLSPNTGLVTGSFVHPVTGNATLIRGVMLWNRGLCVGYFHGSDTSGSVYMQSTEVPVTFSGEE